MRYNGTGSDAQSDVAVATGLSASDVLGRAMVIHDFTGARIACGIISVVPWHRKSFEDVQCQANVPGFGAYPGYTGNLATSGHRAIKDHKGSRCAQEL